MTALAQASLLPAWFVLPLAGLTMLVVGVHVLSVQRSPMSTLRRRVRTLSGLTMMLIVALLAYALGVAEVVERPRSDPGAARAFVLVWFAIMLLLIVVVTLAGIDALATAREAMNARAQLRREVLARKLAKRSAGVESDADA